MNGKLIQIFIVVQWMKVEPTQASAMVRNDPSSSTSTMNTLNSTNK